jgi:hypothetical protein
MIHGAEPIKLGLGGFVLRMGCEGAGKVAACSPQGIRGPHTNDAHDRQHILAQHCALFTRRFHHLCLRDIRTRSLYRTYVTSALTLSWSEKRGALRSLHVELPPDVVAIRTLTDRLPRGRNAVR